MLHLHEKTEDTTPVTVAPPSKTPPTPTRQTPTRPIPSNPTLATIASGDFQTASVQPGTNKDKDNEAKIQLEEDLRLAKNEIGDLKTMLGKVREINQKHIESHTKTILDIKTAHKKQMDDIIPKYEALSEEYKKALTKIAKIQNKKDLLKVREEVLVSFKDLLLTEEDSVGEVDECIKEVKCKDNCSHIVEEDVRNLKEMKRMKQLGGRRNCPLEKPEDRTVNRCPQCDFKAQHESAIS